MLCGQNVSVFAGAKPPLTRGGGQAVNTPLGKISAIAVDHAGTVYFADASQALIMSVTPDGLLTVIAGNGSMQVSDPPQGDGGPAIDAPIPWAGMPIVLDGSGNLFIADDSNIREITTDGIIHTVLRGSQYGLNGVISGLTIDAQGRLFFAELMSHCVWRLDLDGTLTKIAGNGTYSTPTSGGPATNTGLGEACGVAVDSAGNVYVADSSDGLILQVNASDRTIRTFAGAPDPNTGNSTLWDVDSLAFDHQGNLFAFYGVASLARVSQDGAVSPIPLGQWGYSGDGGPASSAQFVGSDAFTNQFAIDDAGNIFFPDGGNGRLRKIDTSGIVNTIAGNGDYRFAGDGGFAKDALLSAPNYVSFGVNGELYVSDSGNHRVRRITPDGVIQTAAGNGETYFAGSTPPAGVPASSSPVGIDIYAATGASDGGFYFSEAWFIRKVDAGGTVSTVAGTRDGYGEPPDGSPAMDLLLGDVEGLALGPDQCLYFTDENVIGKLNPDGSFSTSGRRPNALRGH